jgi:hypothetical protein
MGQKRHAFRVLVEKTKCKRPLGGHLQKQNNIEMHFKEI